MKSCNNCIHQDVCNTYAVLSTEFTAPKVGDIISAFYTKCNERNTGEIGLRLEEENDD